MKLQPNSLIEIYDTLKLVLNKYAICFNDIREGNGNINLWNQGKLIIDGRVRQEIFFAGLVIQKDYVGFYFMPVYIEPKNKEFTPENLQKSLKGKSCFHIKKLDNDLIQTIDRLLSKGVEMYQNKGWIQ